MKFLLFALLAASSVPQKIGDVSSVGLVQLRGVAISEAGSVFSGDRISVGPGAYAKVNLNTGPKVEIGSSSDVIISVSEKADMVIQMKSGNLAFTGKGKKLVHVGEYELSATDQGKSSVAFVGSEAFGVRVTDGRITVRNTTMKQSFTITRGSERLISFRDNHFLVSNAPVAIPAAPTMPRQDSRLRKVVRFIFRR